MDNYIPLTLILYGEPGTGKSALACSAPGPRLIIDAESAGHYAHRVNDGNTDYADIHRWIPGDPIPQHVEDVCVITIDSWREIGPIQEALMTGEHPFRSVIIDSVTELQQRLFGSIGKEKHREVMQRDDWGLARTRFGNFLRAIRDMAAKDMNNPIVCSVFVALSKEIDGRVRPNLQGSVKDDFPGMVDMIGFVRLLWDEELDRESQFLARTSTATENAVAKTRPPYLRHLPPLMQDPNLEDIWTSIQERTAAHANA